MSGEGSNPEEIEVENSDIIAIRDLMKVYKGGVDVVALDNINLNIRSGEFLAIVGPSGSGKSTLLNMIGLLDTPTSGQITLKGTDVTKIGPNERARLRNKELGFVFQYHHLIPEFTALENVMMPMLIAGENKTVARDRAKALLDDVGLGDRLETGPTSFREARTSALLWQGACEPAIGCHWGRAYRKPGHKKLQPDIRTA